MSDRPAAVNGKRNRAWGTLGVCPSCGRCLCFGCHPAGPCVDEPSSDGWGAPSAASGSCGASGAPPSFGGHWYASAPSAASGASGPRAQTATGRGADRL